MKFMNILIFGLMVVSMIFITVTFVFLPRIQDYVEKIVSPEEQGFDLAVDEKAKSGKADTATEQEIIDDLNKKVKEGMINASMNPYPVFETGTSDGDVMIINEDFNNHPQVVEIKYRDVVIYRSGLIPVGSRVETGKLLWDLKKGEYNCIAEFHNVDEKTGKSLGKTGVTIVVKVLG